MYVSVLNNTIEQITFISTNKTKKEKINIDTKCIRLIKNNIKSAKSGLNLLNIYRLFFFQLPKNLCSTLYIREQD